MIRSEKPEGTNQSSLPLSPEDRRDVICVGGEPPRTLVGACEARGLRLEVVLPTEVHRAAFCARAVLIEVRPEDQGFRVWSRRVVADALVHGLAVGLVLYDLAPKPPVLSDLSQLLYIEAKELQRDFPRVNALYSDWERVAQWAAAHEPGPGQNYNLRINGPLPEDPESLILLQRVFYRFSSVTLSTLNGGKSGASVWRVTPGDGDRVHRPLPFVVKLHTLEKIRLERSNCLQVRDAVPQRLHAGFYEGMFIEGYRLGVVVYDLVDRAEPLRDVLTVSNTERLITSLFEHTLAGFYGRARPATRPLMAEFDESKLKILRWSGDLEAAGAHACEKLPALTQVPELRHRLSSLPPVTFQEATVHGDLHVGNLFVPADSSDVVLIDYGSVRQDAPLVVDAACLEVSLSFPIGGTDAESPRGLSSALPDEAWLRATYRYPLSPTNVKPSSGNERRLAKALRAIRQMVHRRESDSIPYAIGVASCLLRYASYGDNGTLDSRALAYELACGLVEAVEREVRRRSGAPGHRERVG